MSKLAVELQQQADRYTITIAGYLSADSAPSLEEIFAKAIECDKILLIFAEKMYINSTGILALFNMIFAAQEAGKQVRIAELPPHFKKMFDVMGLSQDVEIFDNEEMAVNGW